MKKPFFVFVSFIQLVILCYSYSINYIYVTKLCYTSKSTMKPQQKLVWKSYFPWFSYDYKKKMHHAHEFFYWIHGFPITLIIEGVIDKLQGCTHFFKSCVCFFYPLWDPCPTTNHSNMGCFIKKGNWVRHALTECIHHYAHSILPLTRKSI